MGVGCWYRDGEVEEKLEVKKVPEDGRWWGTTNTNWERSDNLLRYANKTIKSLLDLKRKSNIVASNCLMLYVCWAYLDW